MVGIPVFRLACIAGVVLLIAVPASARSVGGPAGSAGARAPALASAARSLAPAARPFHAGPRGRGFHRPGYGSGYGLGGYWPGFYDPSLQLSLQAHQPDYRFERAEPPSIPVAIGISRPPAADPVIYRIETQRGRQVARIIRIGTDGAVPVDTGERRTSSGKR